MSIGGLSFQFDAWSRHWVGLYVGNVLLSVVGYLVILVPLALLTADAAFRSVLTSSLLAIVGIGFALALARGLTGAAIRYRRWRFFVDHLEAFGDIEIDGLRRSETKSVSQGEGLLDALEMGAI